MEKYSSPELYGYVTRILTQHSNIPIRIRIKNDILQIKIKEESIENNSLIEKLKKHISTIQEITGKPVHTIQIQNNECCKKNCKGCKHFDESIMKLDKKYD